MMNSPENEPKSLVFKFNSLISCLFTSFKIIETSSLEITVDFSLKVSIDIPLK